MRRRTLLGLLGSATAATAGCTGIFGETDSGADETPAPPKPPKDEKRSETEATPPADRPQTALPADCPISTIPEVPLPDQPTPGAVESFIRKYEEPYMLEEQFLSYEDELTKATILSVERTGYGYAVEAQFSGANTYLQASVSAQPVETAPESVALDALDNRALVGIARRAAREGTRVVNRLTPPRGETATETRPGRLRERVDALPGGQSGYISVDGTPIQVQVDIREVHADYFTYSVLYYVDSSLVRRNYLPSDRADAREGQVVECR